MVVSIKRAILPTIDMDSCIGCTVPMFFKSVLVPMLWLAFCMSWDVGMILRGLIKDYVTWLRPRLERKNFT